MKKLFFKLFTRIQVCGWNESDIDSILSKRQYIKTNYGWCKGFIIIELEDNKLYIHHDVNDSLRYRILHPKLTLNQTLDYYERL